ncbi:MAG: alpha/beta hydrolase [Acidimicrobiales bacterium]
MSADEVIHLADHRHGDDSSEPVVSEPVPEGVRGLDMPLGRRVRLTGRGTTFVREVAGPSPTAPTVVLLHGWFASGGLNWFNAFGPLSEHFNVVAPDLRGHGRGIRNRRRFRLSACADDVAALCEELGIESAIFCGYSMGGPVAQLMWRRHPDLVSGLAFCATSSSFIPALQQRMIFAGSMALMASTTRTTQLVTRLPKPVRQALPKGLRGTSRPTSLQVWAAQEMRRHDMRMVLEAGTAIGTFSSRRWITGVDVPTTVLITTKDKAVSPASQLQLALAVPGATIQRYDEGHTSPVLESFGEAITTACLSVAHAITRTRRETDRA